jgi:hypothetical protein
MTCRKTALRSVSIRRLSEMFVLWRFGPVRLYRGKREPAGALRRWSPRNVIFTATETCSRDIEVAELSPGPTVRIHLSPAESLRTFGS